MIYKVTITQDLKYRETITGTFDNITEAAAYVEAAVAHFKKAKVSIEITSEVAGDD